MRPLVLTAAALALLAGVDRLVTQVAPASPSSPAPSAARGRPHSPCPPGQLPDDGVCIPVPAGSLSSLGDEHPAGTLERRSHRNRVGSWEVYDHIPRRPDRPADYSAYRYPLPSSWQVRVSSTYDLHLADDAQRRGPDLPVGHGGVDLPAARGTEVRLVPLAHQAADAQILHVGRIFGTSVVTLHMVREGGQLREYVVLHGHLDTAASELEVGSTAPENTLLGTVGDSGSPGQVHLHLEVRRVRRGVKPNELQPRQLVDNAYTVASDPRNVLGLR